MQNHDDKKAAFAAQLLKFPNEPFKAALAVFAPDTGSALFAAANWINDPKVIEEKQRLLDNGYEAFAAEELRDRLVSSMLSIIESDRSLDIDKIKAADQIGKLKGLHPKQDTTINNVNKAAEIKITASELDEKL